MERVVISNISQFAGLAQKHPGILNIPSFNAIKSVFSQPTPTKGCKCKAKVNLSQYRPQFEAAMSVLSDNEKASLKRLLNTPNVCYYKKESNGQIKLNCF